MNTASIRNRLAALSTSAIKLLAAKAEVSERNLWRIRSGERQFVSEPIQEKIAAGLRKLPASLRRP